MIIVRPIYHAYAAKSVNCARYQSMTSTGTLGYVTKVLKRHVIRAEQ